MRIVRNIKPKIFVFRFDEITLDGINLAEMIDSLIEVDFSNRLIFITK